MLKSFATWSSHTHYPGWFIEIKMTYVSLHAVVLLAVELGYPHSALSPKLPTDIVLTSALVAA